MIYADFMKMDDEGQLILICIGTRNDLAEQNITLEDGLHLVFYNDDADDNGNRDDLVVEGVVMRDKHNDRWVAKIDWNQIKNTSELTMQEKQRMRIN